MIFKNNIIFNEAKKSKSSKKKNDIDIKELRANIKRANDAMGSVIGDDYEDDPEEYEMDDEIVSNTDRRLRDYEDENDDEQLGNDEYESDDYESEDDEDDYEDDSESDYNYSLDDYEDDSEDLDDIEDQIDYANDNEYEDNYDDDMDYMNYDGDEDLDNIEGDIEAANDYDGDYEYEDEEVEQPQPQQPTKKPQVIKEREAEMDPMVTGGVAKLPTDGLDDDDNDDLNNIESQVDDASNGVEAEEEGNQVPTDPNLDATDPVYDDDSDPLAGIEDPEEKESERLKKIVLLKQYKELITIITDFKLTVENLENSVDYENDENVTYVIEQLKSMKDKIMFTVEQKFLDAKYTDLLKIYYYFKFGLNSTSKFMEKLINSKQNNKQ